MTDLAPVLSLVPEHAAILHERMAPFVFNEMGGEYRQAIVDSMARTMVENGGIGLSANQVGLPIRLFVMQFPGDLEPTVCFNPEVTSREKKLELMDEGCLSFPNLSLKVSREACVQARYQDVDGAIVEASFEGLKARCFLHELDHLEGVTFTQRVSPLKLQMARKRRGY